MNPLRAIAAMLEALAGWLEEGQAGGLPAKWLVGQAVTAIREVAATARADAELAHFPPDTDQEDK
jgi:hypothetical protein